MTGPTTIGSLSVMALALASDAATRGILQESTRVAYFQLRENIRQCVDEDDPLLEQLGLSPNIRARVSLAVEQSAEQRGKVRTLARKLVAALKDDVLKGSIGISLRRLNMIAAHLDEID